MKCKYDSLYYDEYKNGIIIPYVFLKVGRRRSFIDNGRAGGILAGIDKKTGIINTHGYDEFNNEFLKHPDFGITFQNYQFPYWKQIKKTVLKWQKRHQL